MHELVGAVVDRRGHRARRVVAVEANPRTTCSSSTAARSSRWCSSSSSGGRRRRAVDAVGRSDGLLDPMTADSRMRIDVFTIFPEYLEGPARSSLVGKARGAGLLDVRMHDRARTTDRTAPSTTRRSVAARAW